ncbi:hypothetical protein Ccrd_023936 [Cynara cardunculus var. scolymus]|uniref:Uncharacterized protein n=1 Tax=Cynara cardunculus var. scolymus TaxID=59895 RepID=A0A103G233_CYNCS|nr:hypothetical protein Ccrd_023939 [Cynara cardunculus var. scolymus]KVE63718.1 hypothetical protein Ccrd_023936 [Cynara cardunculus var. scolymus]
MSLLNPGWFPMNIPHSPAQIWHEPRRAPASQRAGNICNLSTIIGTLPLRHNCISKYTNSVSRPQLAEECPNSDRIFYNRDSFNCSNFLDVDWLSSSGNSCEDETYERSTLVGSPIGGQSSDNVINEMCTFASDSEISLTVKDGRGGFSDRFAEWVTNGDMFL